jgi:hypothetical protein
MKREARMLAGSGVAVAALGIGAHVFAWGNPVADKITMWVFIVGTVLSMIGYLAGAGDGEGSEGS